MGDSYRALPAYHRNPGRSHPATPPAWAGQRVAVMGDLQIGMWMANTATVSGAVEAVLAERPALVLLLGDFIYYPGHTPDQEIAEVIALLHPLPAAGLPVYAVLGNHEYAATSLQASKNEMLAARVRQALEAIGIRVLINEAVAVPPPDPRHVPRIEPRPDAYLYLVGIGADAAGLAAPVKAVGRVIDMLPKTLIVIVSMLGLLLPAASFAQGGQQKSQPQQSQTQQGQQQSMDQTQRRQIEERLKAAGFNPGPVDGVFTGETAQALVAYEKARGLPSQSLLIIIAEPTRQALMSEQPSKGSTQAGAQGAQQKLQVVKATTLRDMDVKNQQGETIGEIERVMFDMEDGRVAYVILDFDGWVDVDGRHVAEPWEALKLEPGAREVTLAIDEDKLRQAPGFAPASWPTTVERPWLYDVYNYYGYPPYPALRARTVDRLEVASAETLIGRDVENRQGENFGEIADLAVDLSNGRIAYAVLEYGGWLGLGETLAAVPWQSLTANALERRFTLDITKDQLKTLPSFARDEWPQTLDRQWLSNVYARYGEKPYWETK